ncbi:kinase-like domain-containing protein [Gigaspora rosea]|uniref:Kinase-like domain-containing protein n=1 Tax=Gigaspora rosea TaxID=44941 RepID=A0A397VTE8_9GLOM|nr:kinase-like domain-containing protein [Gigaspora rosea]
MENTLEESFERAVSVKEEGLEKWLEKSISDKYINEFDYSKFTDFVAIGTGGFGTVHKCLWEECKLTVAVKGLNNLGDNANEDFVKELRILQKIGYHPNIIQFYGVTKHPTENYKVILQYAADGDLRDYLGTNFSKLQWSDKLHIAEEITLGLLFLHSNNIIHLDLHSKNILVHKGRMMISDFGLSKPSDRVSNSASVVQGHISYIDPQCFIKDSYKRNKKSDIYSLGFILWEITSGRSPFESFKTREQIAIHVFKGEREIPEEDTPKEYVALYKRCWNEDPEKRPGTRPLHDILECFISRKELSDIQKQTIQEIAIRATTDTLNVPNISST